MEPFGGRGMKALRLPLKKSIPANRITGVYISVETEAIEMINRVLPSVARLTTYGNIGHMIMSNISGGIAKYIFCRGTSGEYSVYEFLNGSGELLPNRFYVYSDSYFFTDGEVSVTTPKIR